MPSLDEPRPVPPSRRRGRTSTNRESAPGRLGPRPLGQAGLLGALVGPVLAGCVFTPPPPLPEELAEMEASERARAEALAGGEAFDPETGKPIDPNAKPDAGGGGEEMVFAKGDPPPLGMDPDQMKAYATAQGDPEGGDFTLSEALAGLPAGGTLQAVFHTNAGDIRCELYETLTPTTVANFVGLARGLRPTLDPETDEWVRRPYYDDVIFHRVIPGFMIQGGDPTGTGRGETGYVIADEFLAELLHDRPGILSMANRGPGSGSGQFFITLAPTPHLDGKHSVFGACDDDGIDVAEHIAAKRGPGDRPSDPQIIETIEIVRQ